MTEKTTNQQEMDINMCKDDSSYTRKQSYEDSRLTHKTLSKSLKESLTKVNEYYEQNANMLTKNFAGAEDSEVHDEQKLSNLQSLTDLKKYSMNMSLSNYEYQNQRGELSFWATLFTFIKVNIVAGFLFLPNGYKNGGWLFSVVAIFLITAFTAYCNISISECTEAAHTYSFAKIGHKAGGKIGYYVVEIGIAISQICFPCSYSNLIAHIVNDMINLWFGTEGTHYIKIGLCLALILIPLCMIRNISRLSSLHFIGDMAVLATVISLTYESINIISSDPNFNFDNLRTFNTGWAKLLGMSITALEGIGVILPIKQNMKDKKKFNLVIIIGTFAVGFILMTFPLIMYLCYQDKVSEIILNNLPLNKFYIQIILVMMVFSVIIVYPVVLYPSFLIFSKFCCGSGDHLAASKDSTHLSNNNIEGENKTQSNQRIGWKQYLLENMLRIFIVSLTIIIGIASIDRFDTYISLFGCGICTPIAFIFPSIFHYLLYKDKQSKLRNFFDIFATILGIAISVVVLIFTLIN